MSENSVFSEGVPCFELTLIQSENHVDIKVPYGALEGFVRSCVHDGLKVIVTGICFSKIEKL